MPKVRLLSITPNYMELLKAACGKPYGNNVTGRGVEAIIKSGHLSILEHCYASFEVKCSVRVLGQLTRHRHLSFTVKSARGSQFDKLVIPNGLFEKLEGYITLLEDTAFEAYNTAIQSGVSEQDAAYLLPQGAETEMVITGNFRAWYEYLPKRVCKRAMPEHRQLAYNILRELGKAAPEIFHRCFLNCRNCEEKSCDFK